MKVPLYRIAHVRSGDKGNTAIVGVFAYTLDFYPLLAEQLTTDQVANVYGAAVTDVPVLFFRSLKVRLVLAVRQLCPNECATSTDERR